MIDLLDFANKYADSFGLVVVVLLFMFERRFSRDSRRKDSFINWYLNFVVGKNIENLDMFFKNVEIEIIDKISLVAMPIENEQAIVQIKMDFISKFDSLKQKVNYNFFTLLSSLDTGLFDACLLVLNDIDDQVKICIDLKVGSGRDVEFDLGKFYGNKNKIYELLYRPIEKLD
ncbi:hypothetical protein B0E43_10030 [Algoriphagus sp. A40]|nr:hypothetical protein B0E43_10030 [Algoriphagus sp. A40]